MIVRPVGSSENAVVGVPPIRLTTFSATICQCGGVLGLQRRPLPGHELVRAVDRPQDTLVSGRREVRLRVDQQGVPGGQGWRPVRSAGVVEEVARSHLAVDRLHGQAHLVDRPRSDILGDRGLLDRREGREEDHHDDRQDRPSRPRAPPGSCRARNRAGAAADRSSSSSGSPGRRRLPVHAARQDRAELERDLAGPPWSPRRPSRRSAPWRRTARRSSRHRSGASHWGSSDACPAARRSTRRPPRS